MSRHPLDWEKKYIDFYGPKYTGRHNITRLDKTIGRAWCNQCCRWVSVIHMPTNGSYHCRKSFNDFIKKDPLVKYKGYRVTNATRPD